MVGWRVTLAGVGLALFGSTPGFAQRADFMSPAMKAFVAADRPVLLVRGARLWDGRGGTARAYQDILIRDGRFAAIGRHLDAPADASIIDGRRRTMIPGLILMHEHLDSGTTIGTRYQPFTDPYIAQVMLAYGVTTARTAGGFDMEGDTDLKRLIIAGKAVGPDLDISVYIGGPGGATLNVQPMKDEAAVRREIDYWAGRGATSIKLYFQVTPPLARAAIAEARQRHMGVAAHLCATNVGSVLDGLDTLEHGMLSTYDLVPGFPEGSCPARPKQVAMLQTMARLDPDGPEVGQLLATLKAHRIAIDPTLSTRTTYICGPIESPAPRERALLSRPDVMEPPAPCFEGLDFAMERRGIDFQARTAIRYWRMGGTVLIGTDRGKVAGAMGPDEMAMLVHYGMPPRDVLLAATRDAARVLHREANVGTIEVGKRADFVLIDGRPDTDISAIRRVVSVARDGIVYDPQKLYDDAKGKIVN